MFNKLSKLSSDTNGGTLTVFAIAIPVLLGAVAVSLEAGYWMKSKSDIQMIADMAAYAGAKELETNTEHKAKIAAQLDALNNGYDSGKGVISVNIPPTTGNYTGFDAVEVLITQSGTKFFSGIVSDQHISYQVRAVAALMEGDEACILSLNSSEAGAITVSGSANVTMTGCNIASNSTDVSAISIAGSATLTAECLTAVGGISGESNAALSCAAAETNMSPLQDPYASISAPDLSLYPTCQTPDTTSHKWYRYLPKGRYCGSDLSFKDRVILEDSGIYIFDGIDVSFKSNFATLEGSGVTIFLVNGATLTGINGGTKLSLSPPTTGPYAGITIFSDPASQTAGQTLRLNGSSTSNVEGLIYAPTQILDFGGNTGSSSDCTILVADKVTMSGNATIEMSGCDTNYSIDPPNSNNGAFIVE